MQISQQFQTRIFLAHLFPNRLLIYLAESRGDDFVTLSGAVSDGGSSRSIGGHKLNQLLNGSEHDKTLARHLTVTTHFL